VKIELFDVPVLRLIEVFNAHAYVVTAPACERRNGFFWGEFEIAHDRSPVLAAGTQGPSKLILMPLLAQSGHAELHRTCPLGGKAEMTFCIANVRL
jgi:hypothetical protein